MRRAHAPRRATAAGHRHQKRDWVRAWRKTVQSLAFSMGVRRPELGKRGTKKHHLGAMIESRGHGSSSLTISEANQNDLQRKYDRGPLCEQRDALSCDPKSLRSRQGY